MVDMRMGEDDRIDIGRIEAEGAVVERFECSRTLEKAAIDEECPLACRQFHARAGDRSGGTVELDRKGM